MDESQISISAFLNPYYMFKYRTAEKTIGVVDRSGWRQIGYEAREDVNNVDRNE